MNSIMRSALILAMLSVLLGCANGRGSKRLDERVSQLVEQTTKSEKAAQRSFNELESIGSQALPYLVGHLGDVRPLAVREISFNNKGQGLFEGRRYYAPVTVHDALAAILNQVTGKNFVFVYSGASPQEREENRRKWIEWCRSTYPDKIYICEGK